MHPFSRGFLSDAVRGVREDVRRDYAAFVHLLDEVNSRAVTLQHDIAIHRDCPSELYGAALFARTLASTQACVLLLEHGLVSQARTVLRSALETLFPLGALANHPHLAEELLQSHEADRRTIAERIRRWHDPELRAAIVEHITDSELEQLLGSKAKSLNQFELSKLADMEDWYLSVYMLLSFSAHGAVSDLTGHLVTDKSGNVIEFRNEPQLQDQADTWAYTIEMQLRAVDALTKLFKLGQPSTQALAEQLRVLVAERGA